MEVPFPIPENPHSAKIFWTVFWVSAVLFCWAVGGVVVVVRRLLGIRE